MANLDVDRSGQPYDPFDDCKTCGGRVRYYPKPGTDGGGSWAHLSTGDWLKNPHIAEPKGEPT